jgi:hypothetical protein
MRVPLGAVARSATAEAPIDTTDANSNETAAMLCSLEKCKCTDIYGLFVGLSVSHARDHDATARSTAPQCTATRRRAGDRYVRRACRAPGAAARAGTARVRGRGSSFISF